MRTAQVKNKSLGIFHEAYRRVPVIDVKALPNKIRTKQTSQPKPRKKDQNDYDSQEAGKDAENDNFL